MSDKKNQALYSVIFDDGTKFLGGSSYSETKWTEIPENKKIKRIFYRLPGGDYLTLAGYEQYYHMVEGLKNIARIGRKKMNLFFLNQSKPLNQGIKVEYAYIMGKKSEYVVSYRISLIGSKEGNRYKLGDITKRIFEVTDEKISKLNPRGWK